MPALCVCVAVATGICSWKNTPLDVWNMYFVEFVIVKQFVGGSPGKKNIKIWSIFSNDYASKTRIEIMCT